MESTGNALPDYDYDTEKAALKVEGVPDKTLRIELPDEIRYGRRHVRFSVGDFCFLLDASGVRLLVNRLNAYADAAEEKRESPKAMELTLVWKEKPADVISGDGDAG